MFSYANCKVSQYGSDLEHKKLIFISFYTSFSRCETLLIIIKCRHSLIDYSHLGLPHWANRDWDCSTVLERLT